MERRNAGAVAAEDRRDPARVQDHGKHRLAAPGLRRRAVNCRGHLVGGGRDRGDEENDDGVHLRVREDQSRAAA